MNAARTTRLLAFLLGLLLVSDLAVHRWQATVRAPLPTLDGFGVDTAEWLVLTDTSGAVRIEQIDGTWTVTSPYTHPADPVAVEAIVATLAAGVRPDGRVGAREDAVYGLEGGGSVRVEVGAGDTALSALYIGNDADGGTSFVRYADSEEVYRARVGGRSRFFRPKAQWRDPQLWRLPPLDALTVDRATGERVGLVRQGEVWHLDGDPDFPVDPTLVEAVVSSLTELRAEAVFSADHPAGLDPPAATLTVRAGAEVRQAALGAVGDAGFASMPDREGTYRLPGRLVHRLVADREAWRDRTLWSTRGVRELDWTTPGGSFQQALDPRTGVWVSRTPGIQFDARSVAARAHFFARPRVEEFVDIDPAHAGFPGERSVIVVGETTHTLQYGADAPGALEGRDAVYVRDAEHPNRIGLIEAVLGYRL